MTRVINIGAHPVGEGHPTHIVAEIGVNHNGDLDIAKKLIAAAAAAGCDAVKFQKRTPLLATPPDQRDKLRETPWGTMTYLDYRYRVEFEYEQYQAIDAYCKQKNIMWYASCWDEEAVDFIEQFAPPCYKIASASLTDKVMISKLLETKRPLILSTGMSTMEQIHDTVDFIGDQVPLMIMHATSTYPAKHEELNLRMITTLRDTFPNPIGYSGHEVGLPTTLAAVVLGACAVERHITLDRAMWGSDQAASVEPGGFERLVHYVRTVEGAMGDGVKRVYDSELPIMAKLRRTT